VDKFEENPGNPDNWAAFKAFNRAAAEGRLLNAPAIVPGEMQRHADAASVFGSNLTGGVNALPPSDAIHPALEQRFGSLADWVLQKHGLAIDLETRGRFRQQIAQASTDAAWSLKRMAAGDYSPDPNAARFPPVRLAAAAISLDALYEK